jgi:very-short-patch-repair endonuclease
VDNKDGGSIPMDEILSYNQDLKPYARELRKQMTDCERFLWKKIRRKQICGVQFYTQKPMGPFILDFYAKEPKLCIELDGGYHFTADQKNKDMNRDLYLTTLGIQVLRFSNLEVLQQCHEVLSTIEATILRLTSSMKNNPVVDESHPVGYII